MAAKKILKYLKGTLHHGIHFQVDPLVLSACCDADWDGDPLDRKSITGMVVFLITLLLLGLLRSSLLWLALLLRQSIEP